MSKHLKDPKITSVPRGLKTGRRDEDVQKHCDLQDKIHENTVLSGEREAAASVRAAMLDHFTSLLNESTI